MIDTLAEITLSEELDWEERLMRAGCVMRLTQHWRLWISRQANTTSALHWITDTLADSITMHCQGLPIRLLVHAHYFVDDISASALMAPRYARTHFAK